MCRRECAHGCLEALVPRGDVHGDLEPVRDEMRDEREEDVRARGGGVPGGCMTFVREIGDEADEGRAVVLVQAVLALRDELVRRLPDDVVVNLAFDRGVVLDVPGAHVNVVVRREREVRRGIPRRIRRRGAREQPGTHRGAAPRRETAKRRRAGSRMSARERRTRVAPGARGHCLRSRKMRSTRSPLAGNVPEERPRLSEFITPPGTLR
mmetsp:Transcript_9438/g.38592  ORF Transcript_9438/g.38592 Transcript_9438/m.38592 type:complete len:209 (-) Transcript_9438:389-1015(-)